MILDNMVINSLLLYLTAITLRLTPKWRLVLLSAGVGTAFALASPLLPLTGITAILVKLPVGLIMVTLLEMNARKLALKYVVFLLYTFCFGGALMGLFWYLEVTAEQALSFNYNTEIPVGAVLLAIVILAWLIKAGINSVYVRRAGACFLHKVSVTVNGKTVQMQGFLDSGNRLTDPVTNAPVVVVEADVLSKWFNAEESIKLLSGKAYGAHMMSIRSVSGNGRMVVFSADKVEVDGKPQDRVLLGVSTKKLEKVFGAKVLLNPLLSL